MTAKDTIAAIATAPGRGGVGIIRISGAKAKTLSQTLTGRLLTPRQAHFGNFYHPQTQTIIDEGLAIFFPAPHSFTGEDVLELQGHGGPVILDLLLEAVTSENQVRMARPGEFSERAFINDKMDLAQAEAIADLINAGSRQAARNAVHSLQGVFSTKIQGLMEQLTQVRIYVEAAIDFPEEEIDFLKDQQLMDGISSLQTNLQTILDQARQGVILQEGMTLVLAGKPNAGKSSLLNALAGRETAIVTDIPGTTRDLLREHIHLGDMPLHIIDTAGLRTGGDQVEQLGMERAWQEIKKADRLLLLVDATNTQKATSLADLLPEINDQNQPSTIEKSRITLIYTKSDLLSDKRLPTAIDSLPQYLISAKTGEGLDRLSHHLQSVMGYQQANEGGFTARRRHLQALEQARVYIDQGYHQLQVGSGELVADDLRQAQRALGEITGQISVDDLLGKIFSSFCIGK